MLTLYLPGMVNGLFLAVVTSEDRQINVEETNTKRLYWHLANHVAQRPTSKNKWNEKLDFVIDESMWQIIYTNYNFIADTTIKPSNIR